MKLVKHKNCSEVAFQIIHRNFSQADSPSQYWSGYWWTIGSTGIWRSIHDSFFVPSAMLESWEEYVPPKNLKIHY